MVVIAQATIGMRSRRHGVQSIALKLAARTPQLPWLVAVAAAVLGALAVTRWIASGDAGYLDHYFRRTGAFFLIGLAVVEYVLSLVSSRMFERGEFLRRAWQFITVAAACRVAGLVTANFISGFASENPAPTVGAAAVNDFTVRELGLLISGPLTMILLATGLLVVLIAYRDVGLLRRPSAAEIVVLSIAGACLVLWCFAFVRWLTGLTGSVGISKSISWVTDPLIGLLLLEAILLRRAVRQMGKGLIGRCWGTYTWAILFTAIGDMGIWAMSYGVLPWQYTYLNSVVWLLAALAFALAPARQVEAIVRARHPWLRAS